MADKSNITVGVEEVVCAGLHYEGPRGNVKARTLSFLTCSRSRSIGVRR